jgi:hypothetical protein
VVVKEAQARQKAVKKKSNSVSCQRGNIAVSFTVEKLEYSVLTACRR